MRIPSFIRTRSQSGNAKNVDARSVPRTKIEPIHIDTWTSSPMSEQTNAENFVDRCQAEYEIVDADLSQEPFTCVSGTRRDIVDDIVAAQKQLADNVLIQSRPNCDIRAFSENIRKRWYLPAQPIDSSGKRADPSGLFTHTAVSLVSLIGLCDTYQYLCHHPLIRRTLLISSTQCVELSASPPNDEEDTKCIVKRVDDFVPGSSHIINSFEFMAHIGNYRVLDAMIEDVHYLAVHMSEFGDDLCMFIGIRMFSCLSVLFSNLEFTRQSNKRALIATIHRCTEVFFKLDLNVIVGISSCLMLDAMYRNVPAANRRALSAPIRQLTHFAFSCCRPNQVFNLAAEYVNPVQKSLLVAYCRYIFGESQKGNDHALCARFAYVNRLGDPAYQCAFKTYLSQLFRRDKDAQVVMFDRVMAEKDVSTKQQRIQLLENKFTKLESDMVA